MDDLPELPFEKVLSYLSLEDRLKARAVSRRWYHLINIFKVKTLCYSERPGKGGLASGAFAENFIRSIRFTSFFNTFGQTILSNLKRLRLSDLHLDKESRAAFVPTIESFAQLEELYIIRLNYPFAHHAIPMEKFRLNLPKLNSIHLEKVCGIEELTLDSPKLRKVELEHCPYSVFLRLNLVYSESVERLVTDDLRYISVKNLKNLKYLQGIRGHREIDPAFLSDLKQLKEIRILHRGDVTKLFEQKQRLGRTDLKIYHFYGLLLDGPDDLATHSACYYSPDEVFRQLAVNPLRLADEISFYFRLTYPPNVPVAPELEISILKRYRALDRIIVNQPIQDVQRFLDLLNNLDNVLIIVFTCPQPQNLFDRLPEHSLLQLLDIKHPPRDFQFQFLFRMKHLTCVTVGCNIDDDSIRKFFRELRFLWCLKFFRVGRRISIEPTIDGLRKFKVSVGEFHQRMKPNLDGVLQYIADTIEELEG